MRSAFLVFLCMQLTSCVPMQDGGTSPSGSHHGSPPAGHPPAASGNVLLVHGGHQLTIEHMAMVVGTIQFITGQAIEEAEILELTESAKAEFPQDPAEWIRQVNGLGQALVQLKTLQDPLQIGLARQMLIAAFHQATRNLPEEQVPLMIRVIYRYVEVLSFDENTKLALTNRDVEAMIDYMEFSYRMSGVERTFTPDERASFARELAGKFPSLPLEQKQFLCSANFMWKLVKANYQNFTPVQQGQFQNQYTQQQVQKWQPPASQDAAFNRMSRQEQQAYLQRKARENMANQNMFTMMNNMSTQNHATMLNTIENFGGTGNYWQVVP